MKSFIPSAASAKDDFGRTGHDADSTAHAQPPILDFRIRFFTPKGASPRQRILVRLEWVGDSRLPSTGSGDECHNGAVSLWSRRESELGTVILLEIGELSELGLTAAGGSCFQASGLTPCVRSCSPPGAT